MSTNLGGAGWAPSQKGKETTRTNESGFRECGASLNTHDSARASGAAMSSVHADHTADRSTLDAAWQAAWSDFLSNRIEIAERRAAPLVSQFLEPAIRAAAASSSSDDEELADRLVTLADLAHIAGAARGDTQLLTQAIGAYDAHLERRPDNHSAMRMSDCCAAADADGFAAFSRSSATLAPSAEIAPSSLCTTPSASRMRYASARTRRHSRRRPRGASARAAAAGRRRRRKDGRHKVASLTTRSAAWLTARRHLCHPWIYSRRQDKSSNSSSARFVVTSIGRLWSTNTTGAAVLSSTISSINRAAILQAYSRHSANFRTLRKAIWAHFLPMARPTHCSSSSLRS